jgi:hypothetical protein
MSNETRYGIRGLVSVDTNICCKKSLTPSWFLAAVTEKITQFPLAVFITLRDMLNKGINRLVV